MTQDQLGIGAVVERRSKNDTGRSKSRYGTIERLTGRYAYVKWNTGLSTRVLRDALMPYRPESKG